MQILSQAVNWRQLATIGELEDYFAEDPTEFQQQIERNISDLQAIESVELDKLALLRMLEITNGCIQWGFRRQDDTCLSVEQTRECMKTVMGFMYDIKIVFPSGEMVEFSPPIRELIEGGRDLYRQAFKQNIEGAERCYYAYSAAQFLVYGQARVEAAKRRVRQEFEWLFTPYYLDRSAKYVAPYLAALPAEVSA
ncbi:MAG: hypothetical protein ACFB9N_05810 [Geitlerinemataceae cyanobacterium]